ncbi:MAG: hypothetical protein M1281_17065 [Chloroflexi bacterium]|nr:hypothetical protein [Chloroflexota bacterium]
MDRSTPKREKTSEITPPVEAFKKLMGDVLLFSEHAGGIKLRRYQAPIARAVAGSVVKKQGLTFVVMFPRQSGKNELQAQIETYLLRLYSQRDVEIVKVSPTFKPQSYTSMRRLQRVLQRNLLTHRDWKKEQGAIYRIGSARIFFLSGEPGANIVGATASLLLEVDEAQDVLIEKFDKEIGPMGASTNVTRVFWGTAWTRGTLLARELAAARQKQMEDGIQRVFIASAEQVAAEVPAYGRYVAEQVAKLGRNNPLVKSQYFSEEIDAECSMFPPGRRARMQGEHRRQQAPERGCIYAFLLDVAGEDEANTGNLSEMKNPGRDATALTIVRVNLSTLRREGINGPTYEVMERRTWVGASQTVIFGKLTSLVATWHPYTMVVDATGVGAGLASFLERTYPNRVIPFVFSSASKSRLGWDFIAICETGRFKEYASEEGDRLSAGFWRQVEACESEILPGPERRMKWGVPDGRRDAASGELLHDDLLVSAALCARLDELEWAAPGGAAVVRRGDPLAEMDREKF